MKNDDVMGLTCCICGIASTVCCCLPIIPIVPALIAVSLFFVSRGNGKPRNLYTIGFVFGIIGVLLFVGSIIGSALGMHMIYDMYGPESGYNQ